MKTLETAELTLNLGNGMDNFTVRGDYEVLEPLAEAAQAYDKAHPVKDTPEPVKPATRPVERSEGEILTGRRAVIAAKLYDLRNRTNMAELLAQKRADERNLAMARKLGLVSTVYCRLHEKELAKLHKLS